MFIAQYQPKAVRYDRKLRELAKGLRQHSTPTEQILWEELRGRKRHYKFRRQHPLHGFIVDFYCYELMLVIEIDGSIHDGTVERDAAKDQILKNNGYQVLRFSNDEVLGELLKTLQTIDHYLRSPS